MQRFSTLRLLLTFTFFGGCFAQSVDNPSCSFHSPNGYTLSWSADPSGIAYFNYTQSNFPMTGNYWTGVSFGQASDSRGEAIIFESQNGHLTVSSGSAIASSSCNSCNQQGSVLQKSAMNIISTNYASLSSNVASAQFSRPLFNDGKSLASCNFWIFYTQPTPVYGSGNSFTTSSTPTSQQICDIVSSCPRVAISSSSTFAPQYTSSPYTEQYTSSSTYATSTSFPQYDQPYSSSTVVYNNPTYASGYVPNSNYQFLNGSLQQQYRDHGSTYLSPSNGPLYDQPNQENPPVLTNAEQNEANYQQILQDYRHNPNPTAGMKFTNNIYGYNYDTGSASSPSTSYSGSSSSGSNSPSYSGTSYSSSPYDSVYSNPPYSAGSVSGSASSFSTPGSADSGPYYYYSSVYPSYLVPGPYYYRVGPYLSYSNISRSSISSTGSSIYSNTATNRYAYSAPSQSSSASSYNTLGFNPLTGVYRDTPSSSGTTYSASTSSNDGQVYYQPSASANAAFTPYFYSPFVQTYTGRQYDAASPTGAAYGPNAVPYQVLEPQSSSYYQATLNNK